MVGGKLSLTVFVLSVLIISSQLSTVNTSIFKLASGIIVTGIAPLVDVLMAFASIFGAGYLLSFLLLRASARSLLRAIEFLLLCMILGAMLISGLLFLFGLIGILYTSVILSQKVTFSLVGVMAIVQIGTNKILLGCEETNCSSAFEKVLSSTLVFFILLVLICASASPDIHGDAMQYHYALPWQYFPKPSIDFYQTIPGSRQYNAGDLLYLLPIKVDDPWNIF